MSQENNGLEKSSEEERMMMGVNSSVSSMANQSTMAPSTAMGNLSSTGGQQMTMMARQITGREELAQHSPGTISSNSTYQGQLQTSPYPASSSGYQQSSSIQQGAAYQATSYQSSTHQQSSAQQYVQGMGGQQYTGQSATQYVSGPYASNSGQITGGSSYTQSVAHQGGSSQYQNAGHRYTSGATVSGVTETSRIIGTEFGQERVISVQQRVDESRTHIISERYVEHEVKVPKRIVREEVIEKIIIVPETIRQEEIIEEIAKIREKIIEVAKPMIIEKIIEIPQIEYVEKIIEVPEKIVQERIKEVEKIQYQDRIHEVVKIIPQERIVEVADIQYRDVIHERVVEVPDYRDEIVYKDVPVPQYVDKPVPNYVNVEVPVDVERVIPVAVEANVSYEYKIPKIQPKYTKLTYPVYLPRFVEVPVAMELLNAGLIAQAESYLTQIGMLTKTAASLCEIENLATTIMKADMKSQVSTMDLQTAITKAWQSGEMDHILKYNQVPTSTMPIHTSSSHMHTMHSSNSVVPLTASAM